VLDGRGTETWNISRDNPLILKENLEFGAAFFPSDAFCHVRKRKAFRFPCTLWGCIRRMLLMRPFGP
jgi:hypothetical protein